MNKQIAAKVNSLPYSELKVILVNAIAVPAVESVTFDVFTSALEKHPLESVISFTTLLVVNETITEESWHEAIYYYLYPMHKTQSANNFQLINCGVLPRLQSVVYCILCELERKNGQKV